MKNVLVTCSLEFITTHRETSALLPISVWVLPLRDVHFCGFSLRISNESCNGGESSSSGGNSRSWPRRRHACILLHALAGRCFHSMLDNNALLMKSIVNLYAAILLT